MGIDLHNLMNHQSSYWNCQRYVSRLEILHDYSRWREPICHLDLLEFITVQVFRQSQYVIFDNYYIVLLYCNIVLMFQLDSQWTQLYEDIKAKLTSAFCIPECKVGSNYIIKPQVIASIKDAWISLSCSKQEKKC